MKSVFWIDVDAYMSVTSERLLNRSKGRATDSIDLRSLYITVTPFGTYTVCTCWLVTHRCYYSSPFLVLLQGATGHYWTVWCSYYCIYQTPSTYFLIPCLGFAGYCCLKYILWYSKQRNMYAKTMAVTSKLPVHQILRLS